MTFNKYLLPACLAMTLSGQAFAQTTDAPQTKEKHKMKWKDDENSVKSKKGYEVLPQCGDWGIGISATPFLNYVGNMFNGSTFNAAPTFTTASAPNAYAIGNINGPALMLKYMKTARLAYRARFQANIGGQEYRNEVTKNVLTPDPMNPQTVTDRLTTTSQTVLLGFGAEVRRGLGRLQGVYGAELLGGLGHMKSQYEYGNAFTSDFTTPFSTTNFNSGVVRTPAYRNKEQSGGTAWLVGVRGFVGAEYFIARKMSIGGEIGYTLGYSTSGKGYQVQEYWNSINQNTVTVTTDYYPNAGLQQWGIGLDYVNAGINFNFFF